MTSAEFKTLREALGLSVADVAKMANVQKRTVQYWESERSKPPGDISKRLTEIDQQLNNGVERMFTLIVELEVSHGSAQEFRLLRYTKEVALWKAHPEFKGLPVTTHAAYLARAKRALESKGGIVHILFDPASSS